MGEEARLSPPKENLIKSNQWSVSVFIIEMIGSKNSPIKAKSLGSGVEIPASHIQHPAFVIRLSVSFSSENWRLVLPKPINLR
jgi:hypothetical protein